MMMCEKSRVVALAVVVAIAGRAAWTGEAVGVETNVAYMKTVYSNVSGATYCQPANVYGSDQSWTLPVPHVVLVDDIIHQSPYNYLYINRNVDGYFRVDLGAAMEVRWVDVARRPSKGWDPYLGGNKIQGLDSNKALIPGYEIVIPTGLSSSLLSYRVDVNWQNVQYVKLLDVADLDGDDDLLVTELRVGANVAGFTGGLMGDFIGDVGVTATNAATGPHYEAANLTNNRGMTDQGGAGVGDPAAKSICATGNWRSTNLLPDAVAGDPGEYAPAPEFTFNLGGTATLNEMRIWNFNWTDANNTNPNPAVTDRTYRGTKEMLIEYSADGGNSYTALTDTNGADPGNYTIARAAAGSVDWQGLYVYQLNDAELAISLSELVADHVRITALSNYADHHNSTTDIYSSYRGLAEVRFYGSVVPAPVPGDTNNDGDVDQADAGVVASNWGATVTAGDATRGDFNNDGLVNAADASILAANWLHGVSEGATVPEPSSSVALLGLLATLALRRSQR